MSLVSPLREAAKWLADGLPEGIQAPLVLAGDVKLDELDAYCVEIMNLAADYLENG